MFHGSRGHIINMSLLGSARFTRVACFEEDPVDGGVETVLESVVLNLNGRGATAESC